MAAPPLSVGEQRRCADVVGLTGIAGVENRRAVEVQRVGRLPGASSEHLIGGNDWAAMAETPLHPLDRLVVQLLVVFVVVSPT